MRLTNKSCIFDMKISAKHVFLNAVYTIPIISYLIPVILDFMGHGLHPLIRVLFINLGVGFVVYIVPTMRAGRIKKKFGIPLDVYFMLQLTAINFMASNVGCSK